MFTDSCDKCVVAMNTEDLVEMLNEVGGRMLSLIRNGEIENLTPAMVKNLPVWVVEELAAQEYLISVQDAREELGLGSIEAVMCATRSKRLPLEAVQVGRTWYFTHSWIKSYLANRYVGRRKAAEL